MLAVDTEELKLLAERILKLSKHLTFDENQSALNFAVKPVLEEMQRTVPVWKKKISFHTRTSRWRGAPQSIDPAYSRGGATKQDLRIKNIRLSKSNEAKVIVGVSKKKGKVGWRTHFIIHGTKFMKANDFMIRSANSTIDMVEKRYETKAKKLVGKHLNPVLKEKL